MPANQHPISVPFNEWVPLTDVDVTAISFQVKDGYVDIRVDDAVEPVSGEVGFSYGEMDGVLQKPLSELVYGVTSGRVWARGLAHPASMVVVDYE